jgi:hypothetical protein
VDLELSAAAHAKQLRCAAVAHCNLQVAMAADQRQQLSGRHLRVGSL